MRKHYLNAIIKTSKPINVYVYKAVICVSTLIETNNVQCHMDMQNYIHNASSSEIWNGYYS